MVKRAMKRNGVSDHAGHRAQQGVESRKLVRAGGEREDVLVEEERAEDAGERRRGRAGQQLLQREGGGQALDRLVGGGGFFARHLHGQWVRAVGRCVLQPDGEGE